MMVPFGHALRPCSICAAHRNAAQDDADPAVCRRFAHHLGAEAAKPQHAVDAGVDAKNQAGQIG